MSDVRRLPVPRCDSGFRTTGLVMIPEERTRLVKLLGLLGSEHDGEVANAGRLADRLIKDRGYAWDQMIVPARDRVLWDWRRAARDVLASELGSDWERNFCWSLIARLRGPVLTARQEQTLKKIFERYFRRAV